VPAVNGFGVKDPAPALPKVEDLLNAVIPKSSQGNNSTENDLQRRRELKKIANCLADWDTVNVSHRSCIMLDTKLNYVQRTT